MILNSECLILFVSARSKCTFKDAIQNEMIAYQVSGGSSLRSVNCFTPLSYYMRYHNIRQSGNNTLVMLFLKIVKFTFALGNGDCHKY